MSFSVGDIVDFRWPADGRKYYRGRIISTGTPPNTPFCTIEVLSLHNTNATQIGATEYSAEVNLRHVPPLAQLAEAAE